MSVPPDQMQNLYTSNTAASPMDYLGQMTNNNGLGQTQPLQTPIGGPTATDTGGGFNWGTFSNVLKTIGDLSNLYFGFQQLDLAREQFDLSKSSLNRNLANQATAYNTELEGRARARLASTGEFERGSAEFEQALSSYVDPRRVSGAPL